MQNVRRMSICDDMYLSRISEKLVKNWLLKLFLDETRCWQSFFSWSICLSCRIHWLLLSQFLSDGRFFFVLRMFFFVVWWLFSVLRMPFFHPSDVFFLPYDGFFPSFGCFFSLTCGDVYKHGGNKKDDEIKQEYVQSSESSSFIMAHRTFVHYNDQDGNKCIREEYFNAQTPFMAIIASILGWLWGDFAFDLQIYDSQCNTFLDFDEKYLRQHNLYIQPMTSKINLYILPNRGKIYWLCIRFSKYYLSLRRSTSKVDAQHWPTSS